MDRILMAAYTNYRRDPRVRREAESLAELGYRVTFIARRQEGEPDAETIDGVEVVKTPGYRHSRTNRFGYVAEYAIFFGFLMLHLTLHPRRYRLVHINNMPDALVFAAWLPRLLGRPVIHDVHDLMPELYGEKFGASGSRWVARLLGLQERAAGRFATAVMTVEERLKDILAGRGIPRQKIHVLMNLPDDRIFAPRAATTLREPAPGEAPDAEAPFVVVYHGTLAYRLGLDVAIRAVAIAREHIPRLRFRIIGMGEELPRLQALRDELGLADVVQLNGKFVAVDQIPAMIRDADLGLVPLRISAGTDIMLPTKLLEYVSLGVPCVVPRTGTIERYFDAQMVQFFQAEDAASLAEAIVALYRDPARRAALAEQATARFGATYRWSQHKRVYTQLVQGLLGGAG